jgi:hypothetical protein
MEPETTPTQETLLMQWQQPAREQHINAAKAAAFAIPVFIALIALAWWLKNLNLALVGGVVFVALLALRSQSRAGALEIALTNQRIIIGKRGYPLKDFKGFWLGTNDSAVEITLETEKPSMLPTTFLFATNSIDEARNLMSTVLPEVEAHEKKLGDRVATYFRL